MRYPGPGPSRNSVQLSGIEGMARLDRKTKNLVKRLRPGDIAVIDHTDIDRVSAELLIEKRPAVVVNARCSITGEYPNLGPLTIVASGIGIVDEVGGEIFDRVSEGAMLTVVGNMVYMGGEEVARGRVLEMPEIEAKVDESKKKLGRRLGDFAHNTMELLEAEKEILIDRVDMPHIATEFAGRHALVVVRGRDHKRDLKVLRPYIREMKPVLVAVDGGADALKEMGYVPDVIVGDMDSVSDEVLGCGAELVVHGYRDGRVPGRKRLDESGLPYKVFHYPGTSEDVAMLMSYEKGADLIVMVGSHTSLVEFLDKDRMGMASTFLVRLRVGSILVDAKGVSRIYQSRVKGWHLALMVLAALVTVSIIIAFSEPVRQFFSLLALRLQVWLLRLQSLI